MSGRKFGWMIITLVLFVRHAGAFNLLEFIFGPKLHHDKSSPVRYSRQPNSSKNCYDANFYVKSYGFAFEEHEVITEDGYILHLHRIPFNLDEQNSTKRRPAVLLHHGIFGASENWIFRGPEKDLCYILSNAGYDVWLSNSRGNFHSRGHVKYNANSDKEYWNFSYHEMGYYDLPASIDYILSVNNQTSIYFIGYSMGSTVAYITLSTRPEYNKKIRMLMSFAGTGIVAHRLAPHLKIIFSAIPLIIDTLRYNKINELFPRRELVTDMLTILCQNHSPIHNVCLTIIYMVVGMDLQQFNTSYVPSIFKYYPSGTSINTLLHYYQMFTIGHFAPLDTSPNLMGINNTSTKINSLVDYDLTKITAPVSLHYGDGDILVTKQDNLEIAKYLPNIIGIFRVPYRHFNHLDFIWSSDSKILLYDQIVVLMEKYR